MKSRKHTNKLYYTTNGRVYFILYGVKYYLDDIMFTSKDGFSICISNCLYYNFTNAMIDSDSISYTLEKVVL